MNHESKCRNLHGHNYVLFCEATPVEGLDELGRVVDFGVMKELLGGWIETNWDHGFIFYGADSEVIMAMEQVAGQKIYTMPCNPTAENMAKYLLEEICPTLFSSYHLKITKITIWETENCVAEATL